MENLYKEYLNSIGNVLTNGNPRKFRDRKIEKGFSNNIGWINETAQTSWKPPSYTKEKDVELFQSLSMLKNPSQDINILYGRELGKHPDFQHLKGTSNTEEHYIISMFIDIKRSTQLFKKYDNLSVAYIITTIQRAAIHTCWYFDGYIQRLHGDGLLVYFGGKEIPIEKACHNAINAASLFSYFVENDLKKLFNEKEVSNISTRIGIDLGYNEDVLWHQAGVGSSSEITTCSLHTSLAFKMQESASSNGIIVGDNFKDNLDSINSTYFTRIKYKTDDGEKEFIFEIPDENWQYFQWNFDWTKYLPSMKDIKLTQDGLMFEIKSLPSSHTNATTFSQVPHKDYAALQRLASQNKPYFNGHY